MTGFESFVGIDPWTALFTFCNMMITFAVLKKFLFKPVKKMIDDRQAEIDTMYADADAAKQKAAELEQEYQQHLQSIRDERDTLLREATARAQKREEEIVGEARAEAAALRAAAEADIAQERKKAVNDLKNEIGGIAVEIAGKVVEREINETDHKALIDEFIRNVGEEGLTERILAELDVAVNAMQEPGYLRLLMTPSVPKKERCALLDQAFAQAHPYLVNFLKILCEAGILPELPACARAYRDRYNQDHNILEVTAVSAVALDESARSRLQEKLQRVTGKTITLTEKVDPSVLGGLRLDLGGTRLDGTVQGRLERLRNEISGVVI